MRKKKFVLTEQMIKDLKEFHWLKNQNIEAEVKRRKEAMEKLRKKPECPGCWKQLNSDIAQYPFSKYGHGHICIGCRQTEEMRGDFIRLQEEHIAKLLADSEEY